MRKGMWVASFGVLTMWCAAVSAQAPARSGAPAPAKLDANMAQLMRGVLYPASNVLFAAQEDLSKQPKVADAATSPNPLTSTYGGWTAVENAGLAIAEASRLITMPGRMCSSGHPAPVARGGRRKAPTRWWTSGARCRTRARLATTYIARKRAA